MPLKWMCTLAMILLLVSQAAAAGEADLQIKVLKPGAVVTVDRVVEDGKLIISADDAQKKPLLGLGAADFTIMQAGRTAKIVSVQSFEQNLDVPRHIVLVLDNSFSMSERNAVKPLRAGVDELLKIVRPIDQVSLVVFDDQKTVPMGGRDLHVRVFQSSDPAALNDFLNQAYSADGMTARTVLFEGVLAGVDLVSRMPKDEPRFMVVFSDGQDLNSAFKAEEVAKAAEGLPPFGAYTIDYMPGEGLDPFLKAFASEHQGQAWKARQETNLVPIFQEVASRMQYQYVVSYLFPPTGSLALTPASLTINEIKVLDASPKPDDVAQESTGPAAARIASLATRADASALTLRPVVDSVYGIARWKISATYAGGSLAELAGEGAPAAEIMVPLPADKLTAPAAAGDIKVTMELQDSKGQNLVLTPAPVKVNLFRTSGSLAVVPASLTIEEIKTIDASPMLGHIYFAQGSSEIPARYVRLAGPEQTAAFDEQQFRDTLDKYYQVLNLVGKRLAEHPAATITLVGCNANTGAEKGNKKLSGQRAEAVRAYLQTVWNIAPERMLIETRNLPEMPSTSRLEEGQADNRRVEIRSEDPAILDLIRSTYLATRIDASALTLRPVVDSPHGVARWKVAIANAGGSLGERTGEGAPAAETVVPLQTGNLKELAAGGDITVTMALQDRKGQDLVLTTAPLPVRFIETRERLAQKQGYRVQEKYALILFDFDSDAIGQRNQAIVSEIVARIRELPGASAVIVGHTDNIGKDDYNLKLSERRAKAVYDLLMASYGEDAAGRISHTGVGAADPLYDNLSPEARAFNRTVTITLEYTANE